MKHKIILVMAIGINFCVHSMDEFPSPLPPRKNKPSSPEPIIRSRLNTQRQLGNDQAAAQMGARKKSKEIITTIVRRNSPEQNQQNNLLKKQEKPTDFSKKLTRKKTSEILDRYDFGNPYNFDFGNNDVLISLQTVVRKKSSQEELTRATQENKTGDF